MPEITPDPSNAPEEYSLTMGLESLKFVYTCCVHSIAGMDFEDFNDRKSLVRLKTCIQLFEQLEEIDPEWLNQNGFSFDKGFYQSWIHWITALNR